MHLKPFILIPNRLNQRQQTLKHQILNNDFKFNALNKTGCKMVVSHLTVGTGSPAGRTQRICRLPLSGITCGCDTAGSNVIRVISSKSRTWIIYVNVSMHNADTIPHVQVLSPKCM